MQKKLIALAIAGLAAAPAFAQTNVTIYGVADLTWEYVDGKGASDLRLANGALVASGSQRDIQGRARLTSNSSLLGFKGVEDLGNGLKAIFQFETGISADTGMGTTFSARDTFVGLSSAWGTILGGNLTHPLRNMGAKVSMSPGATGIGFTAATYGTILGVQTGTDNRTPNTVAYVSPALMGGLTFTAAYINGENARNGDTFPNGNNIKIDAYQWQLAAQYENGPLYLGLGYHQAEDPQALRSVLPAAGISVPTNTNFAFDDQLKAWRMAGTYKFAFGLKLSGLYDRQTYEFNSNTQIGSGVDAFNKGDVERDAWQLGISQDFGPHTIYGEYSQANEADGNSERIDNSGIKQYTLGYNYNFSKRTMLKAYYTEIRNDDSAFADFYLTPVSGGTGQVLGSGADPKGFGVGIRHSF
jgi:predicted porin